MAALGLYLQNERRYCLCAEFASGLDVPQLCARGVIAVTDFQLLAFVILIGAIIIGPIASRSKLWPILNYLIVGLVISPILAWSYVEVVISEKTI